MRFFREAYNLLHPAHASDTAVAGAGVGAASAAAVPAASTDKADMTIRSYGDPASDAIAARYPGMVYIGYGKPTDDSRLWFPKESLVSPPPPPFVPPLEEAKGELNAHQIEFNRLVAEDRLIPEKEATVLRFLAVHPDFNPRYRDKDGYTALFLATKYELDKVANYLVSRHQAENAYTSDHRHELIEGIIVRNDIRAFNAFMKRRKLSKGDFQSSFGEKYIDSNGFKMGLTLVPFMAKLNRREMLERILDEYADAVNKRISNRTTGRGFPSALIEAARAGHVDLVDFLLERGADRNFTTLEGETALSVAEAKGHDAIADLLRPVAPAMGASA